MRTLLIGIVAAAGLCRAAGAVVNTSVVWQVSTDNVNWSGNVNIPNSGTTAVFARAVVSYTGTGALLGLASFVFQPVVSNFGTSDSMAPFISVGPTNAAYPSGIPGGGGNTTTPVGVVTNLADNMQFGRASPWGRSALSSTNFLKGFVQGGGIVPTSYLRIAQAQVTSWIGGMGNTTGGSGVPIAQLSNVGRAATDPAFNSNTQNIVVFKMGLIINSASSRTGLELMIDAPLAGFENLNNDTASPNFGDREVRWWGDMNEAIGSIRGTAQVTPATISLPAPGSVALVGIGWVAARRRRR